MVGDFGWEHEGRKSRVGTVKTLVFHQQNTIVRKNMQCNATIDYLTFYQGTFHTSVIL